LSRDVRNISDKEISAPDFEVETLILKAEQIRTTSDWSA
jgi:hypothetical protein